MVMDANLGGRRKKKARENEKEWRGEDAGNERGATADIRSVCVSYLNNTDHTR